MVIGERSKGSRNTLNQGLDVVETNLVLCSFALRLALGQEARAAILSFGESLSRILSLVFSQEGRAGRIIQESSQKVPIPKSPL